jgi:hypothetical protein
MAFPSFALIIACALAVAVVAGIIVYVLSKDKK